MGDECKRWSPFLAGIALGLILIAAFYTAGRGIGITGGMTRFLAVAQDWLLPELTAKSSYFAPYLEDHGAPLRSYLVFMMVGIIGGAVVAALTGNDFKVRVLRGPNIGIGPRLAYALLGGVLVGFAARLARGCTSGLALVGGAELSVGSWVFMLCVFGGGFAAAYFVRRQWL
jgi:uncharacterized membrane protein YedE/YeeE